MRIGRYALLAWIALAAAGVGIFSLRYARDDVPLVPDAIAANAFATELLVLHAVTAAIALMLGPLQFVGGRRGGRAFWHRITGAAYVAACLLSAPAALGLAVGTTSGPLAGSGFALLALAWGFSTAVGTVRAVSGSFREHGRWMVRSYALTFAAVTLRINLQLAESADYEFETAYPVIAWLCWVPNLLAAELWIRASSARPNLSPAVRR